ncbi:hypothetical protein IPP75_02160 [Candidatus Saccharibacteria bacterium]|nr:MAG: hypothetical protein IPP75_02160 [Candidatus Saccharibacteria bacterium]
MTSPHKDGEYFAWNIAANLLRDPNAPTDVAEFVVDGRKAEMTILAGRTGLHHNVVIFGRTMGSPEIEEICITWMPTNTERKGGHISVSLLPDSLHVYAPGQNDSLHKAIQLLHMLPNTVWDPGLTVASGDDVRIANSVLQPALAESDH